MEWVVDLALFFGLLVAMMLSGMPVAFGFITLNIVGLYLYLGVGSLSLLATSSFSSIGQFSLIPIPLFILIMALANILFSNIVTAAIFGVALNVLYAFVWFRVAISLPSVAVGEHMGSMDAWEITSEHSRDILMMSVVIIVLNSVMSMGVATLFGGLPLVAFILRIIVQWTTMMVGISVLTTLYGHIVEGRSLSGS